MLCPICTVQLKMVRQDGILIDFCPTCWGVWLDDRELDTILERSSAAVQSADPTERPLRVQPTSGQT